MNHQKELNHNLVKLRKKVESLGKSIKANEIVKAKLVKKIDRITSQMARIDERMAKRRAFAREYEKSIKECGNAYNKILNSSDILLGMLKDTVGDEPSEPDSEDETYGDIMDIPLEVLNNPFADEDEQEAERRKYNFQKFHMKKQKDGTVKQDPSDPSKWKNQGDEDLGANVGLAGPNAAPKVQTVDGKGMNKAKANAKRRQA
jgi:chromosome segregation ATPase